MASTKTVNGFVNSALLTATITATAQSGAKVNGSAVPAATATTDASGNFSLSLYSASDITGDGRYDVRISGGNGQVYDLGLISVPSTAGPFHLYALVEVLTKNLSASPLASPLVAKATSTSSPSAGGAGALPATPAGYVTVNIGGVDRVIPYY